MAKRLYFTDASQSKSTTFGYICLSGKIKVKDGAVFAGDSMLNISRAEGLGIDEALKAIEKNDNEIENDNFIITDSNEAYLQISNYMGIHNGKPSLLKKDCLDDFYAPIGKRMAEMVNEGFDIKFILIKSHADYKTQYAWLKRYFSSLPNSVINYINYGNILIDTMVNNAARFELAEPPKDINTYIEVDKMFYMTSDTSKMFNELIRTRNLYKDDLK